MTFSGLKLFSDVLSFFLFLQLCYSAGMAGFLLREDDGLMYRSREVCQPNVFPKTSRIPVENLCWKRQRTTLWSREKRRQLEVKQEQAYGHLVDGKHSGVVSKSVPPTICFPLQEEQDLLIQPGAYSTFIKALCLKLLYSIEIPVVVFALYSGSL